MVCGVLQRTAPSTFDLAIRLARRSFDNHSDWVSAFWEEIGLFAQGDFCKAFGKLVMFDFEMCGINSPQIVIDGEATAPAVEVSIGLARRLQAPPQKRVFSVLFQG